MIQMGNKARKARGQRKPPPIPLDKARAVAKLTNLHGRGVDVTFVPSGIEVHAENPVELERETNEEIVRRGGDDRN